MPDTAPNPGQDHIRGSAACSDCERCRHQPDVDCGIAEHAHCPRCGHCMGRHGTSNDDVFAGWVYLVYERSGRVVAVVEDDADHAAKVIEINRGWGWTTERRPIYRAR